MPKAAREAKYELGKVIEKMDADASPHIDDSAATVEPTDSIVDQSSG